MKRKNKNKNKNKIQIPVFQRRGNFDILKIQ